MSLESKHVSVCVCTYKRPAFLKRLLEALSTQDSGGLFTYSIVVVDNDRLRSAETVVAEFAAASPVELKYCVQPEQSIALARNMAVENAKGDFVAFIDDDEFPDKHWLANLLRVQNEYGAAGVLGPVKRHFDEAPPKWVLKSKFYERPTHQTGFVISWSEARTGNVLLQAQLFHGASQTFRQEFRAGEDQDFFRRMMEKGHVFIWCNEAVVYESVPPVRWKRTVMLRRALLRGATASLQPNCDVWSITKSLIAVPVYAAALPLALVAGHQWFMTFLVKLCDHLGKLLAIMGINPIREPYVTE
jgi:glycosyltransferase involved in cell wall biosynthesis